MSSYKATSTQNTSHPQVTGMFIAHGRLTTAERAQLGADILDGHTRLGALTESQIARLVGVSIASVRKARQPARLIARAWNGASRDERVNFIREAGVETVFAAVEAAL